MPGKGTLKGGTMTGGNPGIVAACCGTVWGSAIGRGGGPVVMATVTVGGLTDANWGGRAVGVVVTTADISTTSGPLGETIERDIKIRTNFHKLKTEKFNDIQNVPDPGVGRRGEAAVMLGEGAELMGV